MSQQENEQKLLEGIAEILAEISQHHMPFGKFGPANFPPKGVPIYDLPYEYLAYFKRNGFPNGKLGRLMEFVYHAKLDGADSIFDSIRAQNGGRTSLSAKPSQRIFKF